jgi:Photosynthesis system II assembly factor YCF48
MDNIPKIARERLNTAPPASHPDPDLLTAFSEHALKGSERVGVMEHLASCSECRELVWLAQPPVSEEPATVPKLSWYSFPALRWATAVAVVLVVGGAILLKHQPSVKPAQAVAQLSAPEQLEKQSTTTAKTNAPAQREPEGRKDAPERDKKIVALSKMPGGPAPRVLATVPSAPLRGAPVTGASAGIGSAKTDELDARIFPAPAPSPSQVVPADKQAANENSPAENVEVTAAAPAVFAETQEVSKAKQPAAKARAPSPGRPVALTSNAVYDGTRADGRAYSSLQKVAFPRWSLATDGALQRSFNGGRSWQEVIVQAGAVFRAVSSSGPEIWAGGAAGLLYHSSDAGQHWTRVNPVSGEEKLSADISAIDFTDVQHGKLTTTAGQLWTTSDAGQSWQKQ